MANCYLAQEASRKSGKYVVEGNKQAWLDLFADDAIVQDPVGVSPLDPTGLGHHGKKAIEAFWDMAMPNGIASFQIRESHPAGDSCANVVTLSNRLPDGTEIKTDCVAVYTANDAGKVTSLRAYWDFNTLAEQLTPPTAGCTILRKPCGTSRPSAAATMSRRPKVTQASAMAKSATTV